MYSNSLDMDFSFDAPVRRTALLSRKMFNVLVYPMDAKGLGSINFGFKVLKFILDACQTNKVATVFISFFSPWKSGTWEVIAIFWTINSPPVLPRVNPQRVGGIWEFDKEEAFLDSLPLKHSLEVSFGETQAKHFLGYWKRRTFLAFCVLAKTTLYDVRSQEHAWLFDAQKGACSWLLMS